MSKQWLVCALIIHWNTDVTRTERTWFSSSSSCSLLASNCSHEQFCSSQLTSERERDVHGESMVWFVGIGYVSSLWNSWFVNLPRRHRIDYIDNYNMLLVYLFSFILFLLFSSSSSTCILSNQSDSSWTNSTIEKEIRFSQTTTKRCCTIFSIAWNMSSFNSKSSSSRNDQIFE